MRIFIQQHALPVLAVCALGVGCMAYPAYANIGSNAGSGQVRNEVVGDAEERTALREEQQAARVEAREAYRAEYGQDGYAPEERAVIAEERRVAIESARAERHELHFAQQNEMYNTLAERRATIVAMSEERRVMREQNREERKTRLTAMAQERLGGYGTRVTEGMERVLEQLTDMTNRVEERINRFSEEGIDVSAAERIVQGDADGVGVYALIDVARADVTVLANLLAEALASEDPKAVMADVREASSVAKESIRLVHAGLRDTVIELKATVEVRSVDEEDVTTGDANGDDSAENSETSE